MKTAKVAPAVNQVERAVHCNEMYDEIYDHPQVVTSLEGPVVTGLAVGYGVTPT